MAKRLVDGRVRKMWDTRPLVFAFSDSDALLQFTVGCRRLALSAPTMALYRVAGGYRLSFWKHQPIPPALFALLTETARMHGSGERCVEAVTGEGTPLTTDLLARL